MSELFLPWLFLGIMLGWSLFWSTEELWKAAFRADTTKIIILDLALMGIIYLYVFASQRDKFPKARRFTHVLKMDVTRYFPSIDRAIL